MSLLRDKILNLKSDNKTYNQICKILHCSKGTVCYYLGKDQKEKTNLRNKRYRKNSDPINLKLNAFLSRKTKIINNKKSKSSIDRSIYFKMKTFFRNKKTRIHMKPMFSLEDLKNKIGENPICYLTGKKIDLSKSRTYHFDHIIPVSRGGDNSLNNLGICTREANQAKCDRTLDEFIQLCMEVINHHNKK